MCRLIFALSFTGALACPIQDFIEFEAHHFPNAIVWQANLFAFTRVCQQVKRDVNLGGNFSGGQKARVVKLLGIASDPIG